MRGVEATTRFLPQTATMLSCTQKYALFTFALILLFLCVSINLGFYPFCDSFYSKVSIIIIWLLHSECDLRQKVSKGEHFSPKSAIRSDLM